MAAVVLEIPSAWDLPPVFDTAVYLAVKLYEDSILSAGQAAELAKLSKRTFIELLGKYGVSPFSRDVADLLEDIQHA